MFRLWYSLVVLGTLSIRGDVLCCWAENFSLPLDCSRLTYTPLPAPTSFANEALSELGYDIVTIDGSVDRLKARTTVGGRTGLQGNYDPRELIEDGTKTVETVRESARQLLEELGPQRLVANLGEGLGGKESPTLVKAFVDAIHEESEVLIKASKSK